MRRDLLRYAVAWELQSKRFGGLSAEGRKALKTAVADIATRLAPPPPCETAAAADVDRGLPASNEKASHQVPIKRTDLQAGTRLIRDWNGRTNVVDVVQGGFLFEGKSYRSLSAIARKITDAHWSGPRFFGL